MKTFIRILFPISFLFSCNSEPYEKNLKIVSVTDNIYTPERIIEKQLRLKLKIESIADSFISYQYLLDTFTLSKLSFKTEANSFTWKQETDNPEVELVDSFTMDINNKQEIIYKFEKISASGINEICYFFSKKFGKIGSASYSQGSLQLLSRWGTLNIEKDLEHFFFQKNLRYLKNSKINHLVSNIQNDTFSPTD